MPKSDFLRGAILQGRKPSALLRYIDILQLRQTVEKQLNKGENANAVPSLRRPSAKFSRAVSFGNNQEFLYGEKVEQEIAEGCRRLIKNAIICWNYLYLTQKIAQAESEDRNYSLAYVMVRWSPGNDERSESAKR